MGVHVHAMWRPEESDPPLDLELLAVLSHLNRELSTKVWSSTKNSTCSYALSHLSSPGCCYSMDKTSLVNLVVLAARSHLKASAIYITSTGYHQLNPNHFMKEKFVFTDDRLKFQDCPDLATEVERLR